ncbi:MAG: putative nucleotidyltransferase with HDIG domain [Candidatus Latescibacterota bacterium]|jgi:putative nucleotidyltransferase with HDIG domain
MANTPDTPAPPSKPKALIVDKKFKPEDLRIPRNQAYVRDLGQCLKIYQSWGYDIIWVDTGIDTMKAIKMYQRDIKAVIIEAHVSGGGITVARLLRFKPDCKHIPVFLMSLQLSDGDIAEGKRLGVLDCLARPFTNLKALEEKLKKGAETQVAIAQQEKNIDPRSHIIKELEKITNLPAMPTVYNEIEKLSRDPNSRSEQYSQIIEIDPGITAQLLRLCNSSVFAFNRKVTSIKDAVNLLGLQTVVDFVRTLSVVGAFKGKATAFDGNEFWKHCIAVGVTAKLLAERSEFNTKLKIGEEDPFMAGMVHDIGKQVLGHFFNDMFQMVTAELKGGQSMYEVEQEVLGLDHQIVGEALAAKWQLPESLIEVIGGHHKPTPESRAMTHLVHVSNIFSKQTNFAFSEHNPPITFSESTLEQLEMDEETLLGIMKELEATIRSQVTDTFSAIFS